jgi:hypothetical protein
LQLFPVISNNHFYFFVFHIFWAKFNSYWHALQLPIVEFPAWIVVISQIDLNSNVSLLQLLIKDCSRLSNLILFSLEWNRNNYDLNISNIWRKYQTFIISMVHGHNSN